MKTFGDVYTRLKEAFPALPYEVTKDITQAFENLEGLQAHRARVLRQADACHQLHQADLRTLEAQAKRAAGPALTAHRAHQSALTALTAAHEALARDERVLSALQAEYAEIAAAHHQVDEVIKALTQDARYREAQLLETRLEQAEDDLVRAERDLTRATQALEVSRADAQSLTTDLATRRQTWAAECRTLAEALQALAVVAHNVGWPRGSTWLDHVSAGVRTAGLPPQEAPHLALTPVLEETSARLLRQAEIERQMGAHDRVNDDRARAHARAREQESAREATATRLATAQDACRLAWDALVSDLESVGQQFALRESAAPSLTTLRAAAVAHEMGAYTLALAAVDAAVAGETEQRNGERARCDQEIGQVGREVRTAAEALDTLEQQSDLSPERRPARVRARAALDAAGIEARPLYTLLDVRPGVDRAQAGQVEAMLLDAGLLDALVVPEAHIAQALTCLNDRGLADCLIATRAESPRTEAHHAVLVVDETVAEPLWRQAALRVLCGGVIMAAATTVDSSPSTMAR